MMLMYVVPPLHGDRVDDNHVRVEHHHALGLTHSVVMIDGVKREVRSTSRIDRWHPITKSRTIMLHLKPLPKPFKTQLTCSHIPTFQILRVAATLNRWPSLSDYRKWLSIPDFNRLRLIARKERTLVRKGYLKLEKGVPIITEKGQRYLEQVHAGN